MSSKDKDLEELIDDAKRQKWQHRTTKEGHAQLFAPDGKGIVVFSGTPSDHRSFDNSLAEMKRLGYRPPNEREKFLERRRMRGVKKEVIEYLSTHPSEPIETSVLLGIIRAKMKAAIPVNSVSSAMSALCQEGKVKRLSRGYYKWNFDSTSSASPTIRTISAASPVPPVTLELFDPDAIDDEKILDEALVALSRVEGIVRKYRGIIRQTTELRKALGTMKAGAP